MPVPALSGIPGCLPLGRYLCTLDEVQAAFVDAAWAAGSSTRPEIWDHFGEARTMLTDQFGEDIVGLVWIGGSFTTDKLDPDDIDTTFLIEPKAFADLSNNQKQKLLRFGHKNRLREKTGLRVEPFLLVQRRVAMPFKTASLNAEEIGYFEKRGMWDDWWLRNCSSVDKDEEPTVADSAPVRGYLEVML